MTELSVVSGLLVAGNRQELYTGLIATSPSSDTDDLYVTMHRDGDRYRYGPAFWRPKVTQGGMRYPVRGEECLVGEIDRGDGRKTYSLLEWQPKVSNPLIPFTLSGDLSGPLSNAQLVAHSVGQREMGIPEGSSFPANPQVGDEFCILAPNNAPLGQKIPAIWKFRYGGVRTGDFINHRWEFIGGGPLVSRYSVEEITANYSWTPLDFASGWRPYVQVPVAGTYHVEFTYTARNATNTSDAYALAAVTQFNSAGTRVGIPTEFNQASLNTNYFRQWTIQGVADIDAGGHLRAQYAAPSGVSIGYVHTVLKVTPIRCE